MHHGRRRSMFYRRTAGSQSHAPLLMFIFALTFFTSALGIDWCNLDTGYTTITDVDNTPQSVYVSRTRDGSVWVRVGADHKSLDWFYQDEYETKVRSQLLRHVDINILESVYYDEFCVMTDINLYVQSESGWHPSYIVTYNPISKATRILMFKYTRNCETSTNLTLSVDKHTFICDGGIVNSCGLRNFPQQGKATDPLFIKYIKLDPEGPDSFHCSSPHPRNYFNFKGSYYQVYVKVATCSPPSDSRYLGYDAKLRSKRDAIGNFMYILDPTQTALRTGTITGWRAYVKVTSLDHEVSFQIWRPRSHDENTFTLIGQTLFRPRHLRFQEIILSEDERIQVKKGDVLGIYFRRENPIAWSVVTCATVEQAMRYIYQPTNIYVGGSYTFKVPPAAWDPCRQYSITAIFGNKQNTKIVEDWKCPRSVKTTGISKKDDADKTSTNSGRSDAKKKHSVPDRTTGAHTRLPLYVIFIICGIALILLTLIVFVSFYCYFHGNCRTSRHNVDKYTQGRHIDPDKIPHACSKTNHKTETYQNHFHMTEITTSPDFHEGKHVVKYSKSYKMYIE